MIRETYLKEQITNEGSIKDFAAKSNMPYTTLLSIKKNVGGTSIDNMFKICRGLSITADNLEYCTLPSHQSAWNVSDDEKLFLLLYRQ